MAEIEVRSQAEFDACIEAGNVPVVIGCRVSVSKSVRIVAGPDAHIEARGSSQPRIAAWERSQPSIVARGSSQPHVVARDSSQPHVVARDISQPHVVAWGYVQLSLVGPVVAKASANVSVLVHGGKAEVDGGRITEVDISTPQKWCDYYGVEVKDDVAVLYKGLDNDYSTDNGRRNGVFYRPGTIPVAPDWDGGETECGHGLHFSPTPAMTLQFNPSATRFVACPVALTDMVVHPDGKYPNKVKARACAAPVWEVDRLGEKIEAKK
jgi:hypothetical protein